MNSLPSRLPRCGVAMKTTRPDERQRAEEEDPAQQVAVGVVRDEPIERLGAVQSPEGVAALADHQLRQESPHAVADQNHPVAGRIRMVRVDRGAGLGERPAELGGREHEWVPRRVHVAPELVSGPQRGVAAELVDHLAPGHRTRAEAVDQHDRDLPPLVRLEHVQARLADQPLRREEREPLVGREPAAGEVVGRRRGQVGRDRHQPGAGLNVRGPERIVQLQHGPRPGRVEPQDGRDRIDLPVRIEAIGTLAAVQLLPGRPADGDQRHADAVAPVIMIHPADHIIAGEPQFVEPIGVPEQRIAADRDADPPPLQLGAPRGVGPEPVPPRDAEEPVECPVIDRTRPIPPRPRDVEAAHRFPRERHRLGVEPKGRISRERLAPTCLVKRRLRLDQRGIRSGGPRRIDRSGTGRSGLAERPLADDVPDGPGRGLGADLPDGDARASDHQHGRGQGDQCEADRRRRPSHARSSTEPRVLLPRS